MPSGLLGEESSKHRMICQRHQVMLISFSLLYCVMLATCFSMSAFESRNEVAMQLLYQILNTTCEKNTLCLFFLCLPLNSVSSKCWIDNLFYHVVQRWVNAAALPVL
jgi:hypothetical protein